jgi:hypothetical protein
MHDYTANPQTEALVRAYKAALVAFNAASATLTLHLAAKSLPTVREISAEENARAAVVAARRDLWAVYENVAAKENSAAESLSSRARSNSGGVSRLEDLEIAPIG